jgi:hypothetical protein
VRYETFAEQLSVTESHTRRDVHSLIDSLQPTQRLQVPVVDSERRFLASFNFTEGDSYSTTRKNVLIPEEGVRAASQERSGFRQKAKL